MKKQLFLSLLAIIASASSIFAQENMQLKPHERAKETFFKLKTDLTLVGEQDGKVYQAFEDFYVAQQKARDEMKASGTMDRVKMKETRDNLTATRNARLKVILTEAQMTKWTNEIEPTMMQQRKAPEAKP